jgi:hypothetical protein
MDNKRVEGRVEGRNEEYQEMFKFPMLEIGEVRMKNINPKTLPHFHGIITKEPNTSSFNLKHSIGFMTRRMIPKR